MDWLVFLDRIGERRLEKYKLKPQRPIEWKSFIGFGFLAGYYLMVWRFTRGNVPPTNVALVRDAMLVLGPAVGAIVQAMFRTDSRDNIAAENTGKMADAVTAAANAGTSGSSSTVQVTDAAGVTVTPTPPAPNAPLIKDE